jgi:hypothetical protein
MPMGLGNLSGAMILIAFGTQMAIVGGLSLNIKRQLKIAGQSDTQALLA